MHMRSCNAFKQVVTLQWEYRMATDKPDSENRIRLKCPCGKKLAVKPLNAGKQLKCPACNKILLVPDERTTTDDPEPLIFKEGGDDEKLSKNAIIFMSSIVGIVALLCFLFIVRHENASHQDKVNAANYRITQVTDKASNWLEKKEAKYDESFEVELEKALADENATETQDATVLLRDLKNYREQLKIETVYDRAIIRLQENNASIAIDLLKEYVASPYAINKTDAKKLIKETEIATSDTMMYDNLVSMTENKFNIVKTTGVISNDKVTHPALQNILKNTMKRSIKKAQQERKTRMLALERKRGLNKNKAMLPQRLRTQQANIRNVCWGDSREIVRKVEDISLSEINGKLKGFVEFAGKETEIDFHFYHNKLVKVRYIILFSETGNPFESDPSIRRTLEAKYGKGKTRSYGITSSGIDLSKASRMTTWELTDHRIELHAFSLSNKTDLRLLTLTYEANTPEFKAYDEQEKKKSGQ